MSEHDKREESAGEDAAPETDARTSAPDAGESGGHASAATPPQRRGARGPAWLALLLALAALVLAARPFWPPSVPGAPQPDASEAAPDGRALAARLDELRQALDKLREDMEAGDDSLRSAVSAVRQRIDERAAAAEQRAAAIDKSIGSLRARLDRVESERNTIQGRMTGRLDELEQRTAERLERFEVRLSRIGDQREQAQEARALRLRLLEIDRLATIARHRLGLGDVEAARRAWQWALDEIQRLEGTRYAALRDAARADFQRLRDYRPPARHDQVERLLTLAEGVTGWPSAVAVAAADADGGDANGGDAGAAGGWRERVGDVFSRLVRVESVDPDRPGIADVARLRTEVRAQLVTAALALARWDQQLVELLVDESVRDIERAFDTGSANVAAALEALRGIETATAEPPALSATRERLDELLEDDG